MSKGTASKFIGYEEDSLSKIYDLPVKKNTMDTALSQWWREREYHNCKQNSQNQLE